MPFIMVDFGNFTGMIHFETAKPNVEAFFSLTEELTGHKRQSYSNKKAFTLIMKGNDFFSATQRFFTLFGDYPKVYKQSVDEATKVGLDVLATFFIEKLRDKEK